MAEIYREGSEERCQSLIGDLADLAASADVAVNVDANPAEATLIITRQHYVPLLSDQDRAFHEWLALTFEQQVADVRAYLGSRAWMRDPSLIALRSDDFVPRGAERAEQMLFACHLEAILAVLRFETCGSGDWRVRSGLQRVAIESGSSALSLKDIARQLRVSAARLGLLFRRSTGLSFRRYARALRIRRAAELIQEPGRTIVDVAQSLGYSDASNFVRDFRNALGSTPRDFRNLIAAW